MRINTVAACAAILAGSAYADDAQKVLKDDSSSAAESSSTSAAPLPTFTVSFHRHPLLNHSVAAIEVVGVIVFSYSCSN